MRRAKNIFSLPHWLASTAALLIVGLAFVTGVTINEQEFQRQTADAQLQANDIAALVEERLTGYFERIQIASLSLSTIIANNPNIGEGEYEQVGARLIEALPEVINVAAAPGNVVHYVYPREPNESVLGLDYTQDPRVMAIIERSRYSRSPQMQGPVQLVQGGTGFIVRTAVYTLDDDLLSERYWGVIALVIEPVQLVETIGIDREFREWDVSITRVVADGQLGQTIFGTGQIFPESSIVRRVSALGIEWDIHVHPSDGWPDSPPNFAQTWMIVIAIAAFLLLMLQTFMRLFRERETAQRRLIQALENLNDGFALYDADDRLVLFNQRYKDFYGKSADLFFQGARFEDIIRGGVARGQYPEAAGREEEWIEERIAAHKKGDTEIEQRLNDGRWLKISEQKTPDGSTVGFRVDITELKNAISQANAANAAKSEFLQVISHELRTPLTAVIGFLSFLSKPEVLPSSQKMQKELEDADADQSPLVEQLSKFQAEIAEFAKRALVSSEHLMRLIGDVLEWSKLEQHAVTLRVEHMTSSDLTSSLIPQFEQLASAKDLRFTASIADFSLEVDSDRMRQVLINLVGNATKFTETGEISLSVEKIDDRAVFRVRDTGPGISQADQEKLFDRFFQVDASVTRNYGGVGLGLSISKYLVNLHRGDISVHSELGKGSEFVVTIPLIHTST